MDSYDDPSPAGSSSTNQGPPPSKKRKKTTAVYQPSAPASVGGGRDEDDGKKGTKGYSCSECHRRKVRCVPGLARPLPCLLVGRLEGESRDRG